MPSKRPHRSIAPGPAVKSLASAWVNGAPRGDRTISGKSAPRDRAPSIAAATTSQRSTMPAPPPAGVSSTARCRPIPNLRTSEVSSDQRPFVSACPASDSPSGPGKQCGNRVSTTARQGVTDRLSFAAFIISSELPQAGNRSPRSLGTRGTSGGRNSTLGECRTGCG